LLACRRTYYVAKKKVFEHYAGKNPACAVCGYNDPRALSIDHMNGDGAEHRRALGGVNL